MDTRQTLWASAPAAIARPGPAAQKTAILESSLTCPVCGHVKTETMPSDACQRYYECEACQTVLRPRPGDCCVFCSYGTVPCPPVQTRGKPGGCCQC